MSYNLIFDGLACIVHRKFYSFIILFLNQLYTNKGTPQEVNHER